MSVLERQYIAITLTDGSVSVMDLPTRMIIGQGERVTPATDALIQHEIDVYARNNRVTPVSWKRIAADDIPADRTFRPAWTFSDKTGFGCDLEKARTYAIGERPEKSAEIATAKTVDELTTLVKGE